MNWVDWIIVVVLLLSTLQAASEGLFVGLFSLGGVIAGLVLGCWEYDRLAPWFTPYVKSAGVANLAGFLAIFFGTVLLAGAAGRVTRWAVRQVGLGFLDRLLGGVFGLLRGAAVVSISLLGLAAFLPENRPLADSSLTPYFLLMARTATWVAPAEVRAKVREGVITLRGATTGPNASTVPKRSARE
jgi:membrane protein required for colicin V production